MNKTPQRNETREHLLATGEQLCLQRGFTRMGLRSCWHWLKCRKARSITISARKKRLAWRYWSAISFSITSRQHEVTPRERLLAHFRSAERLFSEQGILLAAWRFKLSAEVCDLSEPMRDALQHGASRIIAAYALTLEAAQQQENLMLLHAPQDIAKVIYILWLGASLQSKISREPQPLRLALSTIEQWLKTH